MKRRFFSLKWQILALTGSLSLLLLLGLFSYWLMTLNRVTELGHEEEQRSIASIIDTIYVQWQQRDVQSVRMIARDPQLGRALAENISRNREDIEQTLLAHRFLTGADFLSVTPVDGQGNEVFSTMRASAPDFGKFAAASDKDKSGEVYCDPSRDCWEVVRMPIQHQDRTVGTLTAVFPFVDFFKTTQAISSFTSIRIVGEHDAIPTGWIRLTDTSIALPGGFEVATTLPHDGPLDIIQLAIRATVIGGGIVFVLAQLLLILLLFDRFSHIKKLLTAVPLMLDRDSDPSTLQAQVTRGKPTRFQDELDCLGDAMLQVHAALRNKPVTQTKLDSDDTLRLKFTTVLADERKHLLARFAKKEEERLKKLALELHDEVGGRLVSMKVDLGAIAKTPGISDEIKERIARADRNCKALHDFLHSTMEDLSPSVVGDIGLSGAVNWLVNEWRSNLQGVTQFSLIEKGNLHNVPMAQSTAAYRVVQEAITNIVKHAKATNVQITLTRNSTKVATDTIVIDIKDDGVGFDVNAVTAPGAGGRGLQGIRDRVEGFGGTALITSKPGEGTHIVCLLPIMLERPTLDADALGQLLLPKGEV